MRCKRISASTFALSTSRGEIWKTLIRRNTRHDTITLYLPPRVLFRMETFSPSFRAHRVLHMYLSTFRRVTLSLKLLRPTLPRNSKTSLDSLAVCILLAIIPSSKLFGFDHQRCVKFLDSMLMEGIEYFRRCHDKHCKPLQLTRLIKSERKI